MVQVIRSLYANQEAKVRTEYGDTESFSIGKGGQGCVLSPYPFNLYSEECPGRTLLKPEKKVISTEDIEEFKVDGEKVGVVRDFVFLGAKIEDSGSCKVELLRRLALGRAAMIGLNKIWKDKDITITTKCRIVNALVFPVMLYGCEFLTIRKAERRRIDSFALWSWRRLLRISWTARRTNKSVIEELKLPTR